MRIGIGLLALVMWAQTHPVTVPAFRGMKPVLTATTKGNPTDTYDLTLKTGPSLAEAVKFYEAEIGKQGFVVVDRRADAPTTLVTFMNTTKGLAAILSGNAKTFKLSVAVSKVQKL